LITPDTLCEHTYVLTVSDPDGLQDSDEMVVTVIERDQRVYVDVGQDQRPTSDRTNLFT